MRINIERYKYFRDTQLWPLADTLNYKQWLENFTNDEELDIAQRILDFFIYIPDSMINQMLAIVIGKCGYYFKRQIGKWTDDDFKNNCWYSFVPGEEMKPTDSGYVFNRKLRDKLGIPEERIIGFNELQEILVKSFNQNVILVDDFVGSGHQTYVAWCRRLYKGWTLRQLAFAKKHTVVYAPLIVNYKGYNSIISGCHGLGLTFIHLLNEQYSLFKQNSLCWGGDVKLYNKAMNLIFEKSKMLNIPFTNGRQVNDVKGYREQGLALAFEHGIPDACPPIFYWETGDWKPLMNRVYSRY